MALGLLALAVACVALGHIHPEGARWWPAVAIALAFLLAVLAALVSFGAITMGA